MTFSSILYTAAEYVGTVAFALTGAMTAIDRGMDLFGVLFLGVITALGGGTIRDLLLGVTPPKVFYQYEYLALAAASALLIFLVALILGKRYWKHRAILEQIFNVFDAIGLAVFSVAGVEAAMEAGFMQNGFLCVFLGMTTGIGGGILRDMMSREAPFVLRKRIYATAAILGALVYWLFCVFSFEKTTALYLALALVVAVRLLATAFRWSLPRVPTEDMVNERKETK